MGDGPTVCAGTAATSFQLADPERVPLSPAIARASLRTAAADGRHRDGWCQETAQCSKLTHRSASRPPAACHAGRPPPAAPQQHGHKGPQAVESADDSRLLGGATLLPFSPDHAELVMGWQLRPAARGREAPAWLRRSGVGWRIGPPSRAMSKRSSSPPPRPARQRPFRSVQGAVAVLTASGP